MLPLVLLPVLLALSHALRLPLYQLEPSIRRRAVSLPLLNSANLKYHTRISLGDQTFQVLVDTGSADLWVAGTVAKAADTGQTGIVNYAAGGAGGPIKIAELKLGDEIIPNQAFLQVPPSKDHQEGFGIMGLGPSSSSLITNKLPTNGSPPVYNLFAQDRTTPNYFTLLLGREKDPSNPAPGNLTIGEVLPTHRAILDEPRLPIVRVPGTEANSSTANDETITVQHLQIMLDAFGIIGPEEHGIIAPGNVNGTQSTSGSITTVTGSTSTSASTSAGTTTGGPNTPSSGMVEFVSAVQYSSDRTRPIVVLDSGFSLSQVPKSISDAIYSHIPGAEYVTVTGLGAVWIVPCSREVNVTFVFAGRRYPVHPLDVAMDPENLAQVSTITNSRGVKMCVGTFQPFTYDRGPSPNYDIVLGMAFMRNVYSLFDYGDFVSSTSSETKPPYIQLLSITDPAKAHADFVAMRLDGVEPDTHRANSSGGGGGARTFHYAIIAAVVVIVIFLFAIGWYVFRARRRRGLAMW